MVSRSHSKDMRTYVLAMSVILCLVALQSLTFEPRASLAESRSDKRKRQSLREALSEIETPSHATREDSKSFAREAHSQIQ